MNVTEELAPLQVLDAHNPTHREYTGGWWELACTGCDFAKDRRLSHLDWAPHHEHRAEVFRDALLVAGYGKAEVLGYIVVDRGGIMVGTQHKHRESAQAFADEWTADCKTAGIDWDYRVAEITEARS
jgi:hypothetical protein